MDDYGLDKPVAEPATTVLGEDIDIAQPCERGTVSNDSSETCLLSLVVEAEVQGTGDGPVYHVPGDAARPVSLMGEERMDGRYIKPAGIIINFVVVAAKQHGVSLGQNPSR